VLFYACALGATINRLVGNLMSFFGVNVHGIYARLDVTT